VRDVTIREYRDTDLDACRHLWRELTQRHRDIYGDSSIGGDDPGRLFDEYLENLALVGPWVVEWDSAVVALGGLLVEGSQAEVEPVVVLSRCRSHGIGTRLIEHLIEEARRRGVRSLSVRPVARNAEAMACFRRAGFSFLGHVEMFQDLVRGDRKWKRGITLHGEEYRY
jgi:GNAT superfamily N-acetyltransferase